MLAEPGVCRLIPFLKELLIAGTHFDFKSEKALGLVSAGERNAL